MATKREIRSTIRNLCPKVDVTNSYHPEVIDRAIERVLSQMISTLFVKGGNMEPFMKRYGDAVALTVTTDAITNVDYTTLPATYVALPDKKSGIRNIFTVQMGGIAFYPMSSLEADLVNRNTYFSLITNKIGYVVYPDRVEYFGMTDAVRTSGVRMDIIIPFSVYLDTDTVNVPGNASNDLIKGVLELLGVIPPVDLMDDNANSRGGNKQ